MVAIGITACDGPNSAKCKQTTSSHRTENGVARAGYHVGKAGNVLLSSRRLHELSKILGGGEPLEQMLLHCALLAFSDQSSGQIDDPADKYQHREHRN